MSYPPILDIQSLNRAKDNCTLGTPGTAEAIKAALEVVCNIPDDIQQGHCLGDGSDMVEAALRAAFVPQAVDPPSTPSVAPPEPLSSLGEAGTSNSQMSFTPFCTGTPISQPNSPHPEPTGVSPGEGQAGTTPRAKGKTLTQRALSAADKLLVFDIHNTFRHRWFLSWDHLVANVILAQKAKDGKFFWVEFAPQFHAHLVKCAVALVPRPLNKVKKVMFGFILELLNGEGPQAFFDLTKGQRVATLALKEKSTMTTVPPQAKKTQDQHPSKKKKKTSSTSKPQEPKPTTSTPGPWQSAETHFPHHTYGRALASDQPHKETSDHCLAQLNTETKRRTRRGLLDKLQE
ncbi:hypothetical protein BGW80DRAFT_1460428 [Lactifluus volemus]|nr:hypothetical protein BGW80DRAFT_1460428 [Lactifluus volemus]